VITCSENFSDCCFSEFNPTNSAKTFSVYAIDSYRSLLLLFDNNLFAST